MRTTLRLAAGLVVLLLLGACGGEDAKPDPKKAGEQARSVLLTPNAAGSGWEVVSEDEFQTAKDISNAASCDPFRPLQEAVDRSIVAEAQRGLRLQRGTSLGLIDMDVSVLDKVDSHRANLDYSKSRPAEVLRCVADGAKDQFRDSTVDVKAGAPLADVPSGGYRESYDLNLSGPLSLSLHYDIYTWLIGSTAIQVKFIGTQDVITAELVRSVLSKVEAASKSSFNK